LERYLSLLRNCLSTEHILQDLIHVYLCATSMSWQETTDRLQTVMKLIKRVLLSLCHINVLTGNHWQASNYDEINQKAIIIFVPHQCLDRKPLTGFKLWWY
jgi:hypothetical protein